MSVWQSFRTLRPRTRIYIGLGIIAYSGLGLFLSNEAEEKFGLVPTEKERRELASLVPELSSVDAD